MHKPYRVKLELKDIARNSLDAVEQPRLSFVVNSGEVAVRTEGAWLLRVIMGLEPIGGGFVSIDDEPVDECSAWYMRRLMSYVPLTLRSPNLEEQLPAEQLRKRLLRKTQAARKPIVLVEGVVNESDMDACRQMAEQDNAIVIIAKEE